MRARDFSRHANKYSKDVNLGLTPDPLIRSAKSLYFVIYQYISDRTLWKVGVLVNHLPPAFCTKWDQVYYKTFHNSFCVDHSEDWTTHSRSVTREHSDNTVCRYQGDTDRQRSFGGESRNVTYIFVWNQKLVPTPDVIDGCARQVKPHLQPQTSVITLW